MRTLRFATTSTLALMLSAGLVQAADTKAALVPGGPHPYFAAWADAAAAAAEEFGVEAEYECRRPGS